MSESVRTAGAELHMSYHYFMIIDSGVAGPSNVNIASSNGLAGAEPGVAVVLTGIHTGFVNLSVELLKSAPPVDVADWDDVVEISMEAPVGELRARGIMDNSPAELPVLSHAGPGQYRLRIHARGRDIAVDLSPEDPVEDYNVSVWPATVAPEVVHKQSNGYGASVRARPRL